MHISYSKKFTLLWVWQFHLVISPQIGFIRGGRGKVEELEVFPGFATKTEQKQKLSKTKSEGEVKITRPLLHKHLEGRNKLVANNHLDIVPGARDIWVYQLGLWSLKVFYTESIKVRGPIVWRQTTDIFQTHSGFSFGSRFLWMTVIMILPYLWIINTFLLEDQKVIQIWDNRILMTPYWPVMDINPVPGVISTACFHFICIDNSRYGVNILGPLCLFWMVLEMLLHLKS